MINLRSDNEVGAHPKIIEAVSRAFSSGSAFSYGADEWTQRVENRLRDIFDKPDLVAYPVGVGTAANVLALACCTPPWGSIYCHPIAHIAAEETNAIEFYSGARLVRVDGAAGKIDPKQLAQAPIFARMGGTIALGTDWTYSGSANLNREMACVAQLNHTAYADFFTDEDIWKMATKNGAIAAEIVIFFNAELAQGFEFRRKRGGHLVSKMRLISAQLDAYFTDSLWLDNARHANAMARRLVAGLTSLKGVQLLYRVDANEIFVVMPVQVHDALQEAGAQYHPWPSDRPGERAFRLVTAFDTEPAAVDKFLAVAKGSLGSR